jgi:hypothetical protein
MQHIFMNEELYSFISIIILSMYFLQLRRVQLFDNRAKHILFTESSQLVLLILLTLKTVYLDHINMTNI